MFSEDQGCLNHQFAGALFANKPADIIYCDLQKLTYARPGLVLYTVNPVDQPLPSIVVKKVCPGELQQKNTVWPSKEYEFSEKCPRVT